ncbi:MAG: hypothetical protein WBG92_13025 [Thiohalocapsa sp.]
MYIKTNYFRSLGTFKKPDGRGASSKGLFLGCEALPIGVAAAQGLAQAFVFILLFDVSDEGHMDQTHKGIQRDRHAACYAH